MSHLHTVKRITGLSFAALCASLFLLVLFLPQALAQDVPTDSGKCGDNVTYAFYDETGEFFLTGTGPTYDYGSDSNPAPWHEYADKIKLVEIDDRVTTIGTFFFFETTNLEDVSFSMNPVLTALKESAFEASGLKSISIPASVATLGDNVFLNSSLEEIYVAAGSAQYKSVEGVLFNEPLSTLICYPPARRYTSYMVPSDVKEISHHAFLNCLNLKELVLPDSLTKIDAQAFKGSGLTTINLPNSVVSLGDGAFEASQLEEIALPSNLVSLGNKAFASCAKLAKVDATKLTKPFTLGDEAFVNMAQDSVIYFMSQEALDTVANKQGSYTPSNTQLVLMQPLSGSLGVNGGEHPLLGSTLAANILSVAPSGATLSYEWIIDGAVVSTQASYTIPNDKSFVGKVITLKVTGTLGFYGELSTTTNPIGVAPVDNNPVDNNPVENPLPATGENSQAFVLLLALLAMGSMSFAARTFIRRRTRVR